MIKTFSFSTILLLVLACSSKQPVMTNIQDNVRRYKYIYIENLMSMNPIVRSDGRLMSGEYNSPETFGDPRKIITEVLENEGFEIIPDIHLRLERVPETLILKYERYNKRNENIEVKLTFITAETRSFVCSCNSIAKEKTDELTIQKAIQSCMNRILDKREE